MCDTRMHNLRRTEFFQGIEQQVEKYMKKCNDINEAEEAAWDDRRFALKRFISDNSEAIGAYLFPDDEDCNSDSQVSHQKYF